MKPPRALMTEIRGESSEVDSVKYGENIVITGRDLTIIDMVNWIGVTMYARNGQMQNHVWCIHDMIEHTPTRIVVPFPDTFKRESFAPQGVGSLMYFEFTTNSGKVGGRIRTIKYKHPVRIVLD